MLFTQKMWLALAIGVGAPRLPYDQILCLALCVLATVGSFPNAFGQEVKSTPSEVKLDLYGAPLPPGAIARMGSAQWRHPTTGPRIMALSPDGKLLATTSFGPTIQLFDAQSGIYLRALPELVPQTIACTGLAFSSDGTSIVSGYIGGVIRWNDASTGEELLITETQHGRRMALLVSADGKTAVTWGEDQRIGIWDALGRKHIRDLTGHNGEIARGAVSADGRFLATFGRDGVLRFWDINGGRELGNASIENFQPEEFVFSNDGKRLALADRLERTEVWDVDSRQRLGTLKGCAPIAYSPLERVLALSRPHSAPRDPHGGIILCEEHGDEMRTREFEFPGALVASLQFARDGKTLFVGHNSVIDRLDVATGQPLHKNHGHLGGVTGVAISPDGRLVASTATDGTLIAWELRTGREKWRLDGFPQDTRILAFGPDGEHLLFRTVGAIRVTDVATHQGSKLILANAGHVEAVAVSPVSDLVAVGAKGGPIEIWDWKRGKKVQTIPTTDHLGLAFASDGKRLLSTGIGDNRLGDRKKSPLEPSINQWDVRTGERLPPVPRLPYFAFSGAFSADDKYLGLVSGNEVKIYDLAGNREASTVKAMIYRFMHQVIFARQGERIAIAEGAAVRVWNSPKDVGHLDPVWIFNTPVWQQHASCIQFSSTGDLLVSGNSDGTLLVFQIE